MQRKGTVYDIALLLCNSIRFDKLCSSTVLVVSRIRAVRNAFRMRTSPRLFLEAARALQHENPLVRKLRRMSLRGGFAHR